MKCCILDSNSFEVKDSRAAPIRSCLEVKYCRVLYNVSRIAPVLSQCKLNDRNSLLIGS